MTKKAYLALITLCNKFIKILKDSFHLTHRCVPVCALAVPGRLAFVAMAMMLRSALVKVNKILANLIHGILLLVFSGFNLSGQNIEPTAEQARFELLKIDTRNAVNGLLHTYSRPQEWKKKDWLTASGIALGTAGLFLIDEGVHGSFTRYRETIPKTVDDLAFYFGKPQYNYGLTTGIYLTGLIAKNERIRRAGILLITAASASGLIQTISKTAIGRARPSTNVGNDSFKPFDGTPDYHSFPSGHTVLAITTMYALGKQIKNPWLKSGVYALGMVTPVSRLWTNAHWLSDVGLSVAISVVVVDTVEKFLDNTGNYDKHGREKSISWNINGGPGQLALIGTF